MERSSYQSHGKDKVFASWERQKKTHNIIVVVGEEGAVLT